MSSAVTDHAVGRAQRIALVATTAAIAATRFIALARGPWDWDEVLFCLAVRDYDVGAHQPHPPGFPFYIFLARIVRFVADSDFHALQTVNVIAGMLAFPVMYLVARAFRFDFLTSFWTAVLFAFLPNVWFYGGTAFSDLPAAMLFLAAVAAFLFAAHSGNERTYYAGSILLACALMVRPQNVPVAIYPWALATWHFAKAQRRRVIATGAGFTAGLAFLGYFIGAWATGFVSYAEALYHHSQYVKTADSVEAATRLPFLQALARMLDPFQGGKAVLLLNVLALTGLITSVVRRRFAIVLTFAPFFVFAFLIVNPLGSSRFSLNWIAGVVLLAAAGIAALTELAPRLRTAVFTLLLAVFLVRFIPWTLPAFDEPRRTDAPPVAAAKWIAANVPRSSIVYVDESIWPWAKYFDRVHVQVRPHGSENVLKDGRASTGYFISMEPARATGEMTFARPRNRTWNLVTQRAFEAYVIPARSLASFDHGWYSVEGNYPDMWRWSSKRAVMRFVPMRGATELRLDFEAPVKILRRPVHVTFKWNGQTIGTYTATKDRNEVRYVVMPRADRTNVLAVEVGETFIPSRMRLSDDWRQLGIMLRSWEWRPLRSSSLSPASPSSAFPTAPRTAPAPAPRSQPGLR